jgi:hypothetical protein
MFTNIYKVGYCYFYKKIQYFYTWKCILINQRSVVCVLEMNTYFCL